MNTGITRRFCSMDWQYRQPKAVFQLFVVCFFYNFVIKVSVLWASCLQWLVFFFGMTYATFKLKKKQSKSTLVNNLEYSSL